MTLTDLAKLVKEMRTAQGWYFKERTAERLNAAVRLEKQVDAAVKSVLEPTPQGDLFDRKGGGE